MTALSTVLRSLPRRIAAFLMLLVLGLGLPGQALALENRSGDAIIVPTNETIADDLLAAGQTVTIAGRVNGDVYAFAQSVVVTGTIDGDLIAAAAGPHRRHRRRRRSGRRSHRSRLTVELGATLRRARRRSASVRTAGSTGSLLGGASSLDLFGPIGRGLTFGAGSADLAAPVGGNVKAGVETLTIEPSARIGGALEYHSQREQAFRPGRWPAQ